MALPPSPLPPDCKELYTGVTLYSLTSLSKVVDNYNVETGNTSCHILESSTYLFILWLIDIFEGNDI